MCPLREVLLCIVHLLHLLYRLQITIILIQNNEKNNNDTNHCKILESEMSKYDNCVKFLYSYKIL